MDRESGVIPFMYLILTRHRMNICRISQRFTLNIVLKLAFCILKMIFMILLYVYCFYIYTSIYVYYVQHISVYSIQVTRIMPMRNLSSNNLDTKKIISARVTFAVVIFFGKLPQLMASYYIHCFALLLKLG